MTPLVRRLFALLVIVALVAACGGGAGPSTPRATEPAASGDPAAGSPLPAALEVTAESLAFAPTELSGPAGIPFTISMWNRDDGVPHNVLVRAGLPENDAAPGGPDLFTGEIVRGPATVTYEVPALPAGSYTFACQVHPNMIGTLALR